MQHINISQSLECSSMKIMIVNGSPRKNGATAQILYEMQRQLEQYDNVDMEMVHVADLELKYCAGCGACYQKGDCIYQDDLEKLSLKILDADGIILGSPTYASNVSGQMKVVIDRGHFVMEQLLYGKYAVSVVTYENYGGKDCAKVLNRLLTYSGARLSGAIVCRNEFHRNPLEDVRLKREMQKVVAEFYQDIAGKRKYLLQDMKHFIVFYFGIRRFVLRKGAQYEGVVKHWKNRGIMRGSVK